MAEPKGWYMEEVIGITVANSTIGVHGWDGDGSPVYERIPLNVYREQSSGMVGDHFVRFKMDVVLCGPYGLEAR